MENILVINNDIETMTLLKGLLEKRSFQVKFTASGPEGITMAREYQPDIILVDVMQKSYIEDLKTHPDTHYIPLILMTGYNVNSDNLQETKADAIIEKPFYLDHLINKMKFVMASKPSKKLSG